MGRGDDGGRGIDGDKHGRSRVVMGRGKKCAGEEGVARLGFGERKRGPRVARIRRGKPRGGAGWLPRHHQWPWRRWIVATIRLCEQGKGDEGKLGWAGPSSFAKWAEGVQWFFLFLSLKLKVAIVL